eukprot:SAG31_NODE_1574_length_7845_cov_6.400207_6_plen_67_part_00
MRGSEGSSLPWPGLAWSAWAADRRAPIVSYRSMCVCVHIISGVGVAVYIVRLNWVFRILKFLCMYC